MSLVIHCPHCATRYEVADSTQGKRVRCKKCENVFAAVGTVTAAEAAPLLTTSKPLDELAGYDLAQFPALPPAMTPRFSELPSHPSGGSDRAPDGPSDVQMRLVCVGMIALGIVLAVGSAILNANTGTVYLAAVALIPLMLVLGIAGLISPNVVRACGKYGGHLPWQYKAIGWGLMGLSFLLMLLLFLALFSAGFQPDRPGAGGGGNEWPGLDRSQTADSRIVRAPPRVDRHLHRVRAGV